MTVKIKCQTPNDMGGQMFACEDRSAYAGRETETRPVKVRIVRAPLVDTTQLRSIIFERARALVL